MPVEREAPHVMQLHNLDGGSPAGDGQAQLVPQPATAGRRQMAASFQLNVDNVGQVVCPNCSKPSESIGLALNLTIGPVPEGVQVLMVRPGATMREVVDDVRRALINDALRRVNNNQARAAKLLGMKYTTFHTLARRLGIVRGPK
jgi:transcriptional regulator with GAF, ATPase, and Fis domain